MKRKARERQRGEKESETDRKKIRGKYKENVFIKREDIK